LPLASTTSGMPVLIFLKGSNFAIFFSTWLILKNLNSFSASPRLRLPEIRPSKMALTSVLEFSFDRLELNKYHIGSSRIAVFTLFTPFASISFSSGFKSSSIIFSIPLLPSMHGTPRQTLE
jgi:hypothetical protein